MFISLEIYLHNDDELILVLKKHFLRNEISGSDFYDYTDSINNKKNNKWDTYDNQFLKYLKDNEIDLTNKSILSISDEPGFIVKKIKN